MRPRRRTTILLGCGLLLGTASTAAAIPTAPPPGGSGGPPAAWVETSHGDRWLGFGGGCWAASAAAPPMCALVPPTSPGMPRIRMRAGETVIFHLGFVPTGVVGLRGNIRTSGTRTLLGRAYRLGASEVVRWTVRGRSGRAQLSAPAAQGGPAYLFDVVIR